MRTPLRFARFIFSTLLTVYGLAVFSSAVKAQTDDPSPPQEPVKLIFIHHSTGENWLQDGYGNLGIALESNNYFVSDTNYGWGPDSIGDRTDIVNWVEWFGPERNENALEQLFRESEQHSWWTRNLPDPGGENRIVLFKSCFPNSELSGSPTDPPTPGDYELSVGSAKYIYQSLLDFFLSRPDVMFVAITAPPVSSHEYAANARAFNNWLVDEWLANYPGHNVYVFDFFNVLTGPENHHRFRNGQVEHAVTPGMDTLYYPSGDDHPNQSGSRKATEEFVPLLNVFYHRWQSHQPETILTEIPPQEEPAEAVPTTQPSTGELASSEWIMDFEDGASGWENHEDGIGSQITCGTEDTAYTGAFALRMDVNLVSNGYGGCGTSFETLLDWSGSEGLAFFIKTQQPDTRFSLILASIIGEEAMPFEVNLFAPVDSQTNWKPLFVPWSDLRLASWVEQSNQTFDPARVAGIEFSFGTGEQSMENQVWVDDLHLARANEITNIASQSVSQTDAAPLPEQESSEMTEEENENPGSFINRLCPAALVLPLITAHLALRKKHRDREK